MNKNNKTESKNSHDNKSKSSGGNKVLHKSTTEQWWLDRHLSDPYVKLAQKEGYRSRASFKLLELHETYQLFKPGMRVVDLGAAPGGWSQVVARILKGKGQIFALDILEFDPILGVETIIGDFQEESVLARLEAIVDAQVDWVLSDMSPNLSGHKAVDIPKGYYLCDLALDFAVNHLKPGGGMLVKIFQGAGFEEYLKSIRQHFDKVQIKKPKASRSSSKEVYILATGYTS